MVLLLWQQLLCVAMVVIICMARVDQHSTKRFVSTSAVVSGVVRPTCLMVCFDFVLPHVRPSKMWVTSELLLSINRWWAAMAVKGWSGVRAWFTRVPVGRHASKQCPKLTGCIVCLLLPILYYQPMYCFQRWPADSGFS